MGVPGLIAYGVLAWLRRRKRIMKLTRSTAVVGAALLFTQGCLVGPDYQRPELTAPQSFHNPLPNVPQASPVDLREWWLRFEDPLLNSLITRAAKGNLDLREAMARIDESRAQRGISASSLFPALDGKGSYFRSQQSENGALVFPGANFNPIESWSTGFDMSWELDMFGRIRRSIEAADADLGVAGENYRDSLVSLYSEVARHYVNVRLAQQQLAISRANQSAQERSQQIAKDRFDAGAAPELDLAQAKANLADTLSEIPTQRASLQSALNRLCVLLGLAPGSLDSEFSTEAGIPTAPANVALGIPANLLRQRPDLRSAERQLAAQIARIGVAKADLYPQFSLSGSLSLDAADAATVFNAGSRTYSFGPSFRWNVFRAGQIRNNIRAADARAQQALAGYERTLLLALEEVENALVGLTREQERRDALKVSVASTRRSVELAGELYRAGQTDFQNLLDSQRSLLSAENRLAVSEATVAINLITLFKALGGGWNSDPASPTEETTP